MATHTVDNIFQHLTGMIEESNLNLHLMGKQVFRSIAENFFPLVYFEVM